MISVKDLEADYNCLIKSINKCIKRGKYTEALNLIELSANLLYQYNFLPDFVNADLERALEEISVSNFEEVKLNSDKNKIIFYDYFGYDNRGLTQQYIRALMHLNIEFIYILENANSYYGSSDIITELNSYPRVTTYILSKETSLEKTRELLDILKTEKVTIAFMHLSPWDVVAYMAFYLVKGITRYQINLTDHAFWLGKNISDFILEFRSFGYNLSLQGRGIAKEKLRIMPYYPIVNDHIYKGLPEKTKGKKILFSGGSVYKILGDNLSFLFLIKNLLDNNSDLVFVFAGSGNMTSLLNFITTYNLQDKIFLIGDRQDISAVLKHVDYYITTYPFTGALMSQIAAACEVPIFFFSNQKYQCNELGDLFYKQKSLNVFENQIDLIKNFKDVYTNREFLEGYGKSLKKSMITPEEFSSALKDIFERKDPFDYLKRQVNVQNHQQIFSSYLLESENNYNPQYHNIIYRYLPNVKDRNSFIFSYFKREYKNNLTNKVVKSVKKSIKIILKNF